MQKDCYVKDFSAKNRKSLEKEKTNCIVALRRNGYKTDTF